MSEFSTAIRQFVALRADFRCEYCRKPEIISNFAFHIEHIISRQHKGSDHLNNLAFACSYCNWKKGPNIATLLVEQGPILPLFHPRQDIWTEHFLVLAMVLLRPKQTLVKAPFVYWSSMHWIGFLKEKC